MAKAIQNPSHSPRLVTLLFARGFTRVILDRVQDNLDQAPSAQDWGGELDADAAFNFLDPPSAGEGRS
jgi:hypothetical protein